MIGRNFTKAQEDPLKFFTGLANEFLDEHPDLYDYDADKKKKALVLLAGQWMLESGDGTSRGARENLNFGGLTSTYNMTDDHENAFENGLYWGDYQDLQGFKDHLYNGFFKRYGNYKDSLNSDADYINMLRGHSYIIDRDMVPYHNGLRGKIQRVMEYLGENDIVDTSTWINEDDYRGNGGSSAIVADNAASVSALLFSASLGASYQPYSANEGMTALPVYGYNIDAGDDVSFLTKFGDSLANAWYQNGIVGAIQTQLAKGDEFFKYAVGSPYDRSSMPEWTPTERHKQELDAIFGNNEARKEAILSNAVSDSHYERLVEMHIEHQKLQDKVDARPIGMHSAGAIVGALLGPENLAAVLLTIPTGGASLGVLASRLGLTASRLGMSTIARMGTSTVARIGAVGVANGLMNTADGYLSEKYGGYEQNHIANFALGTALGSGISAVGHLMKKGLKGKAVSQAGRNIESDANNVILQSMDAQPMETLYKGKVQLGSATHAYAMRTKPKTLADIFKAVSKGASKDMPADEYRLIVKELQDLVESETGLKFSKKKFKEYIRAEDFNQKFHDDRVKFIKDQRWADDLLQTNYGEYFEGYSFKQMKEWLQQGITPVSKQSKEYMALERELVEKAKAGDHNALKALFMVKDRNAKEVSKLLLADLSKELRRATSLAKKHAESPDSAKYAEEVAKLKDTILSKKTEYKDFLQKFHGELNDDTMDILEDELFEIQKALEVTQPAELKVKDFDKTAEDVSNYKDKIGKVTNKLALGGTEFELSYNQKHSKTLKEFAKDTMIDARGRKETTATGSIERDKQFIQEQHYQKHLNEYQAIYRDSLSLRQKAGALVNPQKYARVFNEIVSEAYHLKYRDGVDISNYPKHIQDAVSAVRAFRETALKLYKEYDLLDIESIDDPNELWRGIDYMKLEGFIGQFKDKQDAEEYLIEYFKRAFKETVEDREKAAKELAHDILHGDETVSSQMSRDKTPGHLKQRYPMNTSYQMKLGDDLMFSFDKDLRDTNVFGMMNLVAHKDSAFIAAKRRGIDDLGEYLTNMKDTIQAELRSSVSNKGDAEKYMDAFYRATKAIYGVELNPLRLNEVTSGYERTINAMTNFSYAKAGMWMGMNQLAETMGSVAVNGVKGLLHYIPALHDLTAHIQNNITDKNFIRWLRKHHFASVFNNDYLYSPAVTSSRERALRNKSAASRALGFIEDTTEGLANITSAANGLSALTRYALDSMRADIFADAIEESFGKYKSHLAKNLFTEDAFERVGADKASIMADLKKYFGNIKGADETEIESALKQWSIDNPHNYQKFHEFINTQAESAVLVSNFGNKPIFTNNPLARAVLQFKSFTVRANAGHLMRIIDHGTRDDIYGFMASSIANAGVYAIRKAYKAVLLYGATDTAYEYLKEELEPSRLALIGMQRSAQLAGLSTLNDAYEILTGAETSRTTVNRLKRTYTGDTVSGYVGFVASNAIDQIPFLSHFNSFYRAYKALANGVETQEDINDIYYSIPLINHPFTQLFFAELVDSIKTQYPSRKELTRKHNGRSNLQRKKVSPSTTTSN